MDFLFCDAELDPCAAVLMSPLDSLPPQRRPLFVPLVSGSSHPEGKNPWTAANTFPKHKIPIKCKYEIQNSESLVVGTGIVNGRQYQIL